jgi:predicted GTPase
MKRRVIILGAAGRDFHNFNVRFRDSRDDVVVAFTATQIPEIAGRRYPAELAGPAYSDGIPIVAEEQLERLIRKQHVDRVVFSYSDVSHEQVMHLASRAVAAGADFELLGAESTMLPATVPVVSVCAVRTGCGKSPVSRRVVQLLRGQGLHPVVVRHPMPYGDLAAQRVQRFATAADLARYQCTVEEREEYEPHIAAGTVVFAGVDYHEILRMAQSEGDVIVWDGGNNDTPLIHPDLEIVVVDPHRAGHELLYFPGEVNLLRAHVVIINKVDTATHQGIEEVRRNVQARNPRARILEANSEIHADRPERIRGAHVLVVEDGPTLTHGGMAYGAGTIAAWENEAASLADPKPHAAGRLREVFQQYDQMGTLLPAMGYSPRQLQELEETIRRTPCDAVVVATPVDLAQLIHILPPVVRVTYTVVEKERGALEEALAQEIVSRAVAPV